jgi:formamidopyrimidine-DNA glycosylase
LPELPEVETTRRGISPYLLDRKIIGVVLREKRMRWPVPDNLPGLLKGKVIQAISRRAKYLLLKTSGGTLLLHLGMSGNLRIQPVNSAPRKHDHLDLVLDSGRLLRFHDPRRFGCVLWLEDEAELHPLLANLGPEPLSDEFCGDYLFARSRRRQLAVKNFIMSGPVVVGVGNIYASESLFLAGIRPGTAAGRLSRRRYTLLSDAIKEVLVRAIEAGGTTLRDFVREDGRPGYFANQLNVYGREGEACLQCSAAIRCRVLGQRSTFYCSKCQS